MRNDVFYCVACLRARAGSHYAELGRRFATWKGYGPKATQKYQTKKHTSKQIVITSNPPRFHKIHIKKPSERM